jgi:hypothetical protein
MSGKLLSGANENLALAALGLIGRFNIENLFNIYKILYPNLTAP